MVIALATVSLNGQEQEFRIDSDVFLGQQDEKVSENLTLFSEGVVYDFRFDPGEGDQQRTLKEVVVFRVDNEGQGDFVLFDVEREVMLRMDARQVYEMVNQMKTNPTLRERAPSLIDPQFEENWDEANATLFLRSEDVSYTVTGTRTTGAGALQQYHNFANWYARLNAADPRKMPPFPRLALNEATSRHGLIPESVELVLRPDDGFLARAIHVSSRHYIVLALSRSDRQYIERAKNMFEFRPINREGYFKLDRVADN